MGRGFWLFRYHINMVELVKVNKYNKLFNYFIFLLCTVFKDLTQQFNIT